MLNEPLLTSDGVKRRKKGGFLSTLCWNPEKDECFFFGNNLTGWVQILTGYFCFYAGLALLSYLLYLLCSSLRSKAWYGFSGLFVVDVIVIAAVVAVFSRGRDRQTVPSSIRVVNH
eukprot:GILI01009903.1.p1 GENE.GILI01009903.1~~GILI01009903.1.p1  ORF type:complete len:116 (+),score=8.51 GILI01009903.1:199-546(+)